MEHVGMGGGSGQLLQTPVWKRYVNFILNESVASSDEMISIEMFCLRRPSLIYYL